MSYEPRSALRWRELEVLFSFHALDNADAALALVEDLARIF
jgi:hypothetical protein